MQTEYNEADTCALSQHIHGTSRAGMVREGHATYVRVEIMTIGSRILTLCWILAFWAFYVRFCETVPSSMIYLKPLYE